MRKTIKTGMYACLLAAALMTGGCGQKTETVQTTKAETNESVETTAEETRAEEAETEAEECAEEESKPEEANSEEANSEEAEAEVTETEAEELEREAESAAEEGTKTVVLADIYSQIEQKAALNVPMLVQDDFITNYYGMDLSVLEDYLFEMSEAATSAEMIVIMKVKDGEDTKGIEAALQEVVNSKAAEMENYLPDQFDLVKKGEVKVKEQYVYLVISEHADVITEIIEAEL